MNPDRLANLNQVLKYSSDTVENLLTQFQTPEHAQTRWGGDGADHTFRGVLADALTERDRETEAGLLRDPNQHVLVHEGRVRPARFTDASVRLRGGHLARELGRFAGFDPGDNVSITPDVSWLRAEDFAEPPEPLKNGQLYVTHFSEGEPHAAVNVHHSELGPYMADFLNNETDGYTDADDMSDEDQELLNSTEKALREAPYETVDTSHPSERQKS